MDLIESTLATEYVQITKRKRYNLWNNARRVLRSKRNEILYPDLSFSTTNSSSFVDQQQTNASHDQADEIQLNFCLDEKINDHLIESSHRPPSDKNLNILDLEVSSSSVQDDEDFVEDDETPSTGKDFSQIDTFLHDYTTYSTFDYCNNFTTLTRQAKLCKSHVNEFLSLIKSGLPEPNNLPSTHQQLFSILNIEELFTKRSICLSCNDELNYPQETCHRCKNGKTFVAHVYV